MIVMSYACTRCNWTSGELELAVRHGKFHRVNISGYIEEPKEPVKAPEVVEREHQQRILASAKESQILRLARDRGLL